MKKFYIAASLLVSVGSAYYTQAMEKAKEASDSAENNVKVAAENVQTRDYYKIIGAERGETQAQIAQRYVEWQKQIVEQSEAFEVLCDPTKRAEFDAKLNSEMMMRNMWALFRLVTNFDAQSVSNAQEAVQAAINSNPQLKASKDQVLKVATEQAQNTLPRVGAALDAWGYGKVGDVVRQAANFIPTASQSQNQSVPGPTEEQQRLMKNFANFLNQTYNAIQVLAQDTANSAGELAKQAGELKNKDSKKQDAKDESSKDRL